MLELHTDKETNIDFKLNIEGNNSTPICRLALQLNNQVTLHLVTTVSIGMISVTVPPLKELLQNIAPSIDAYLEVIVDNNYYIPWNGNITILEDISIDVEPVSSSISSYKEPIEVSAILTRMEKTNEKEEKRIEENISLKEEDTIINEEEVKESIEENTQEIEETIENSKIEKVSKIDSKEEIISNNEKITVNKEYIVEGFLIKKGAIIEIMEK